MSKSQRTKGHSWEREVARRFREIGFSEAKRGLQTRGGAAECPDVHAGPFDVECKVGKRPPIRQALDTATEHARRGQIGIAVIKEDRKPPFVVIGLDDFLDLVQEWKQRGE